MSDVELDEEAVDDALEALEDAMEAGQTAASHDEIRPSTIMMAEASQEAYRLLVNAHPDYELEEPDQDDSN